MATDPEKRIQEVMEKLSYSPSPKLKPSPSSGNAIGKRRAEWAPRGGFQKARRLPTTAASGGAMGSAPPCRPWDRGDLLRRLATFKAMTWFGKPKVVSPVNCARRGWINVEMDVISCEACGARLLFSTPASWTLQQVEKAAAVFSLKLDNGHKHLCPWIDNACNEALALFPKTPPAALIDGYKERSLALLQLTALPLISSSAIDYMKCHLLEQFLSRPFHSSITLNGGMKIIDSCSRKDLEGTSEAGAANLYYQALKIISICGWKPRLLPYVVDHGDQSSRLVGNTDASESSLQTPSEQKDSIIICSSSSLSEVDGEKDTRVSLGEHHYDPASVVLDCKFCGACVGLWAFAIVQRPLEYFNLFVDPSSQTESATCSSGPVNGEVPRVESFGRGNQDSNKGICDAGQVCSTSKERGLGKERRLGLKMTIAGGPPPTVQNFRPRVSFPVVSRHLRAGFASNSGSRNYMSTNISCENQMDAEFSSQQNDPSHEPKDISPAVQSEGVSYFRSNDAKMQSRPEEESHVIGNSLRIEEQSGGISSESNHHNSLQTVSFSAIDTSLFSTHNIATEKGDEASKLQNVEDAGANNEVNGFTMIVSSANREEDAGHVSETNIQYGRFNKFDPIKQHRPFCPWIAEDDGGKSLPGWKLTLSALDQQENDPSSPGQLDVPSALLNEADDPVVSIRNLFTSPPIKRLKGNR